MIHDGLPEISVSDFFFSLYFKVLIFAYIFLLCIFVLFSVHFWIGENVIIVSKNNLTSLIVCVCVLCLCACVRSCVCACVIVCVLACVCGGGGGVCACV